MKIKLLLIALGLFFFKNGNSQIGRLMLSPLQVLHQTVAKTDITITYSRPAKRERIIFGGLEPYGKIWRTGANRNSKIRFSQDVIINNSRLERGSYAIYTRPNPDNWDVYFYQDTTNWEVADPWIPEKVVAQINVPTYALGRTVQSLTMTLDNLSNDQVDLNIFWDNTGVVVPIQLTTEDHMSKTIADVLHGPTADDYYLAALYRFESNRELEQALTWIDKSLEIRSQSTYWEYRLKAKILHALNRNGEAKTAAMSGLKIAKDEKRESIIIQFDKILKELNKNISK